MDLQNEAIELQKVFHQDHKTYCEETEAIKSHLESRFKSLGLYDVCSGKVDYKKGFELAQSYINESPCDPDIYKTQLEAWDKYQQFLIDNNIT